MFLVVKRKGRSGMSEIDKVKEEISWLKVLFGLLVAISEKR